MKAINTLCQKMQLLNVKAGGTYSYYWALKVQGSTMYWVIFTLPYIKINISETEHMIHVKYSWMV
jgi:hypothetical protein